MNQNCRTYQQVVWGAILSPAVSALAMNGSVTLANCPCQQGGSSMMPYASTAPAIDHGAWAASGPVMNYGIAPTPPGTLGQTYHLPSRPVPATEHPRTGIIEVHAPSATLVIVRWTNDFRTEEVLRGSRDTQDPSLWRFESPTLLPGLAHIHRVEIYHGGPGTAPSDVRYVRLIKGRVVTLRL